MSSEQNEFIKHASEAGFTGISTDFKGNWWGWLKGKSHWIKEMAMKTHPKIITKDYTLEHDDCEVWVDCSENRVAISIPSGVTGRIFKIDGTDNSVTVVMLPMKQKAK